MTTREALEQLLAIQSCVRSDIRETVFSDDTEKSLAAWTQKTINESVIALKAFKSIHSVKYLQSVNDKTAYQIEKARLLLEETSLQKEKAKENLKRALKTELKFAYTTEKTMLKTEAAESLRLETEKAKKAKASLSRLQKKKAEEEEFLANSIRNMRKTIEATNEWRIANGFNPL